MLYFPSKFAYNYNTRDCSKLVLPLRHRLCVTKLLSKPATYTPTLISDLCSMVFIVVVGSRYQDLQGIPRNGPKTLHFGLRLNISPNGRYTAILRTLVPKTIPGMVLEPESLNGQYVDTSDVGYHRLSLNYLSNRPQQRWNSTQVLALLTYKVKSFSLLSLLAFFGGGAKLQNLGLTD